MTIVDKDNRNNLSISSKFNNKEYLAMLKKDVDKLSYEESISEMETILVNAQDENISLDQIKINYIKGHLLLKHCEELLDCVEREINEINPECLK